MKKTLKILLFVFALGAIFSIGFLIFGIVAIQDKYKPENIQVIENKNLQLELENKYAELKNYFGEENIQIDYAGELFNEIRITHIPTGIITFGNEHKTQLKNAILALEKLKLEIEKRFTTKCKNNCLVLAYSENPADFPLVRQLLLN